MELVINAGTTIVMILMVFLIQNSQNRDSAAIQVNLVHNSFVGIEHLTDKDLSDIRNECEGGQNSAGAGQEAVQRTGKKAKRAADRIAH